MVILTVFLALLPIINCVTVNIKYGDVLGRSVTLDTGETVNSFYAIPFAKPPIQGLRFQVSENFVIVCSLRGRPFDSWVEGGGVMVFVKKRL